MKGFLVQSKLPEEILKALKDYQSFIPTSRKIELFKSFIPKALEETTLTSVTESYYSDLLIHKFYIVILDVIYDDLADNPLKRNPNLLKKLFYYSFDTDISNLNPTEINIFNFAYGLWIKIFDFLENTVHFDYLNEIINFDIEQFFSSIKYSNLLTTTSHFSNPFESKLYQTSNMAMLIFDMMDLCCCDSFIKEELGFIRHLSHLRQRLIRISNTIYTFDRESAEGDITNECYIISKYSGISVHMARQQLEAEWKTIYRSMLEISEKKVIHSFNCNKFCIGAKSVDNLYKRMKDIV